MAPPMTLGNVAPAQVRLVAWCFDRRHQVKPNPTERAQRYGAEMTLPDWRERLVCSECGCREVDVVVTGTARGGTTQMASGRTATV